MALFMQQEWQRYLDGLVHERFREMERRLQHRKTMVLNHAQQLERQWILRETSQPVKFYHLLLMDPLDGRIGIKRMRKVKKKTFPSINIYSYF